LTAITGLPGKFYNPLKRIFFFQLALPNPSADGEGGHPLVIAKVITLL